jgi:tartrate-resistant acid phosphatase type 5
MRSLTLAAALAVAISLPASPLGVEQAPAPITLPLFDAVLAKLPAPWREVSAAHVKASESEQQRFLRQSDVVLRQVFARMLVRVPALDAFIRQQLIADESPAVRITLVQLIAADARWSAMPDTAAIIERSVSSDPDHTVSIAALETLRRARMRTLNSLLTERVARAKTAGPGAALEALANEQQRWTNLERGVMLPAFMQEPPPVFAVTPADRPIRVLAFGDFGNGQEPQKNLAATLADYGKTHPFDFGFTLGDNFYTTGMHSPSDPRWRTWWEDMYAGLGITFYPTLGNHDWGHPDSPASEILYSAQTKTWRMPAAYYTYTAGSVQFFAIDTQSIAGSEKQLAWLDRELARSQARFKVVYGHHVIYSGGQYQESESLKSKLLPLLRDRADVYMCGHDHNLQALRTEAGVHFYVVGGGGAGLYELRQYERSVFASRANGFAVLEADQSRLIVKLVDVSGETIFEDTIRKDAGSAPGK